MSAEFDASRRRFIVSVTIVGGVVPAWPVMSAIVEVDSHAAPSARVPLVSFHLDQPYLDLTGIGMPYRPPEGFRSGDPLCAFEEALLRHHHAYAI